MRVSFLYYWYIEIRVRLLYNVDEDGIVCYNSGT